LRWFAANPSFELIFAPHIMLFERRVVVTIQPPRIAWPGRVKQSSFDPEDVLVDTGSRALTTMEYLNRADIYLGDASSQIYEFLVQPRPSIFLNAHGFDWQGNPNFAHWRAGRVLSHVDELGGALSNAFEEHELRYRAVQEEMVRQTFDLQSKSSSDRAAEAIMKVAREGDSKRAQ
jgi:CDP-glycerol glycerophosphotransferase (TagB/SpsB family)